MERKKLGVEPVKQTEMGQSLAKRIAYLGPEGTYTEEALHRFCQLMPSLAEAALTARPTIVDCLLDCDRGQVDYAVVPLENSIEGSVNMTLDFLIHHAHLPIRGEIALSISHYALVHPNNRHLSLNEVNKVLSHPQAIAQCHQFIRQHCPEAQIETTRSTAEAAEHVAAHPEEPLLAIAPQAAGRAYGLHQVQAHIEDHQNNYTRFVLVGPAPLKGAWLEPAELERSDKTSLLVTLPEDFPGALHQVLSAFAWRKLNLSRIESRPTKKKLGSYFFIIDVAQAKDDTLIPGAIAEIEALGCHVRLLGSYPCFTPREMNQPSTMSSQ